MIKKLLIKIIQIYKKFISPHLPPACIYHPTCSEYTMMSIEKFGAIKGIFCGILRILRCNSYLFKGGYDPVLEKFNIKELFYKFKYYKKRG